jgi:DNA polymerase-3 subunit delta'
VVESLRLAARAGRLPHAWLFVGPEGIGKRTFALRLAQALLCENRPPGEIDPCGVCTGCAQVAGQTHPDLHLVARPEDRTELPIAVIRDLCAELMLKPMRGAGKVAIVDDADEINDEAANAFLKTLEEPPEGSALILIGTAPELQLDTIVSRCRVVRFDPLPPADLTALLLEQGMATTPEEADRLAGRSEGSLARAHGLADAEFDAFRAGLIADLAHPGGFDAPALARRLEAFIKEAGKEGLAQRTRASVLFGELARFFRSVLWRTAGLEPPSSDPADRVATEKLAARLEPEDVFLLADRCLLADYQVNRMAGRPALLDAFAADVTRIMRGA